MKVSRSNTRKGGDIRDAVTRLNLVATDENERLFLAQLGEAVLSGAPITIGEKVWERVPVTEHEQIGNKYQCPKCGREVGRAGRFYSSHKLPLGKRRKGRGEWCEGGGVQVPVVQGEVQEERR